MQTKTRLHAITIGDTELFEPTALRPVRVRARSMQADAHFEPHAHPWAQLAYCATGILQVTAERISRRPGSEANSKTHSKPDSVANVMADVISDDKENTAASALEEMTYIVPPSRAVWIAPNARHHITVRETAEFRTLYIHASATPRGWQGCRMLVVSALLRESIQALDATSAKPMNSAREQLLMGIIMDELTHADTQALGVPMPPEQTGDKRLRALCKAVLQAPSERATLAEWAADIGASERTVARLFRDELGLSYQQWRQQAILAHALPLLARGQSISDVAAASGYASDSAFSSMFKTAMGESPSYFQKKKGL